MPNATTDRSARTSRVTVWDYAAIGLLAAAGFALSYDALRQMAIAIHVRGPLTYLFPLIIDGFVAYSVRALLLLRTAPLTARAYVWLLFGASTAASIWANTLHAVRLNQQTLATSGHLHLSDTAVGVLSAISPLALAGAVHLGIHTTRHTQPAVHGMPTVDAAPRVSEPSGSLRPQERVDDPLPRGWSAVGDDLGWTVPGSVEHAWATDTVDNEAAGQRSCGNTAQPPAAKPAGRPPGVSLDELADIAVQAWTDTGRLSRSVVRDAVRAQGLTLSDERLTTVMKMVRPNELDDHAPADA
ncbi:DUF2637 domain-containing protein [Kitasatospora sp. CM 4170]|uniref:DUF2637 domain-containing protein n=1 Tax=Kitasatospora aburaviensis TaxID=67265 RepID=A0ABW1F0R7_9ACTN|nr:DUF2637 domain-containing protein [Kitasatospora sp. CM 4170]WNM47337.1 DUF2637 domain-containing protein [Kitasatospora sp. CM 4170]